ncbi:MAG: c-type cytochrome [Thiotrichaceae bacterium]|nr:c-type cytochrome [Thiotrichaceae bacterium]
MALTLSMKKIYILMVLFLINSLALADDKIIPNGESLYKAHCARCHHESRIGGATGSPLIPAFLKQYKVKKLSGMIKDGFPQTLMPVFNFLSDADLVALAKYIKSPMDDNVKWNQKNIRQSIISFNDKEKNLGIKDLEQVLPVVERDGGFVWIMEADKILDKFELKNVHGGIKYTMNGENIYIPTRDGWIERYSLKEGRRISKVRPCINLRNVSLSRDGNNAMATCLFPKQMVVLDTMTLEPKKIIQLDGKISALYEFYSKDKAIFTYRDKPIVGVVDTKTFEIEFTDIKEPIEDFFIDPFDEFLIATARRGKVLRVYDINTLKPVFEHKMEGMPHLFSATYWYRDGSFYFATPHLRRAYITVWKMYDWGFEKQIDIGGDGFFVKTHPNTDYLWVDNGSDTLVLINKKNDEMKKMVPAKDKQYLHAEFSGDGQYTYLSIYEEEGSIDVLETQSLKTLVSYPANVPVGKYNFINKNRQFYPRLFGLDIFNQRCQKNKKPILCMKRLKGLDDYEKRSIDAFIEAQ